MGIMDAKDLALTSPVEVVFVPAEPIFSSYSDVIEHVHRLNNFSSSAPSVPYQQTQLEEAESNGTVTYICFPIAGEGAFDLHKHESGSDSPAFNNEPADKNRPTDARLLSTPAGNVDLYCAKDGSATGKSSEVLVSGFSTKLSDQQISSLVEALCHASEMAPTKVAISRGAISKQLRMTIQHRFHETELLSVFRSLHLPNTSLDVFVTSTMVPAHKGLNGNACDSGTIDQSASNRWTTPHLGARSLWPHNDTNLRHPAASSVAAVSKPMTPDLAGAYVGSEAGAQPTVMKRAPRVLTSDSWAKRPQLATAANPVSEQTPHTHMGEEVHFRVGNHSTLPASTGLPLQTLDGPTHMSWSDAVAAMQQQPVLPIVRAPAHGTSGRPDPLSAAPRLIIKGAVGAPWSAPGEAHHRSIDGYPARTGSGDLRDTYQKLCALSPEQRPISRSSSGLLAGHMGLLPPQVPRRGRPPVGLAGLGMLQQSYDQLRSPLVDAGVLSLTGTAPGLLGGVSDPEQHVDSHVGNGGYRHRSSADGGSEDREQYLLRKLELESQAGGAGAAPATNDLPSWPAAKLQALAPASLATGRRALLLTSNRAYQPRLHKARGRSPRNRRSEDNSSPEARGGRHSSPGHRSRRRSRSAGRRSNGSTPGTAGNSSSRSGQRRRSRSRNRNRRVASPSRISRSPTRWRSRRRSSSRSSTDSDSPRSQKHKRRSEDAASPQAHRKKGRGRRRTPSTSSSSPSPLSSSTSGSPPQPPRSPAERVPPEPEAVLRVLCLTREQLRRAAQRDPGAPVGFFVRVAVSSKVRKPGGPTHELARITSLSTSSDGNASTDAAGGDGGSNGAGAGAMPAGQQNWSACIETAAGINTVRLLNASNSAPMAEEVQAWIQDMGEPAATDVAQLLERRRVW